MPEGKYFLVRSALAPNLALDVKGGGADPGSEVITWDAHGGDNQQWYVHHPTGTLRSKVSGLCMDLQDNRLVVNSYQHGEPNQQWTVDGDKIALRHDPDRVLDIVSRNTEAGGELCAWNRHGGENQSWTFEHREAVYFYLESALHGKVLDIAGGDPSPGSSVIIWPRKDDVEDNQLWYEDRHSIIRSKLNDLILDATRDRLEMDHLRPGEPRQCWVLHGERVANKDNPDDVLDIKAASEDDGAELCAWEWHGADNQRWNARYL